MIARTTRTARSATAAWRAVALCSPRSGTPRPARSCRWRRRLPRQQASGRRRTPRTWSATGSFRASSSRSTTPPKAARWSGSSVRKGPPRGPLPSADAIVRPIRVEYEPGDDSRIVAGRKLRNPRRDPAIAVFGVGDDVWIAPGAHGENPGGFVVGIAEGVQAGAPLRTEQEVAGSELLLAVEVADDGPTAEDEEHLFGAVVHVELVSVVSGAELVQAGAHPRVVGPPEDAAARVCVLDVPGVVGEQVLAIHQVYLRCASGYGRAVGPPSGARPRH